MKKGFTLIEMMVVVAIMALLASISFSTFQSYYREQRFLTATGDVFEIMLRARDNAIAEKQCVKTDGTLAPSLYWRFKYEGDFSLQCVYGDGEADVDFPLHPDFSEIVTVSLGEGQTSLEVDFYGDPYQVVTSEDSAQVTMTMLGDSLAQTICLDPVQGFPRLIYDNSCPSDDE